MTTGNERESRIAIDIGGTFTDVVFRDRIGGIRSTKVVTRIDDVAGAILEAIEKIGTTPPALGTFVHGTTIALNALLEGKAAPVGLITTSGFRDVLEIMRTNRPDMYDLQQQKPVPLVPRRLRLEIGARMTYAGEIIAGVDEEEIRSHARTFIAAGITNVAVCLLHAYANPAHERDVGRILIDAMPDVEVSLSSDLSRVWREFERTSTTVSNAATKPLVSRYLEELELALTQNGFDGEIQIMRSNGGVMSSLEARQRPVATLMSGPIGGVTGAVALAKQLRAGGNLVTLDIGGTSADVAIVDGGEAVTRSVGHIGAWPVMVPMIDIEAIGAGGGSIARVDEFRALSVGPESAGADPGPACYGRGGIEPTVTDAHVVVGRINPNYFLGGELRLDVEAARRSISDRIARPYGMTCEQAAEGMIDLVNSNMVRLLWEALIGRGYDPREFSLLSYGGAGPLHAGELAEALGVREVRVPRNPGTFSAFGILTADVRRDYERMVVGTDAGTSATLARVFAGLEHEANEDLSAERAEFASTAFIRSAELRYVGQDHPLLVELPSESNSGCELLGLVRELFHSKHERLYGFRRDDARVELVRLHLLALGRLSQHSTAAVEAAEASKSIDPKDSRPLFVDGHFQDALIYERAALPFGAKMEGPCILEEPSATTYVPPGFDLLVEEDGNLLLARKN
jgi:N-methylhydantoinase A